MAKLLIFLALCIASSLAKPSTAAQPLAASKGDVGDCAKRLHDNLVEVLKYSIATIRECSEDCANELEKFLNDLKESVHGLAKIVKEKAADYDACGNDAGCKARVLKEVAELITQNIEQNKQIVNDHLESIRGNCPAAAECVEKAYGDLIQNLQIAIYLFTECIKA